MSNSNLQLPTTESQNHFTASYGIDNNPHILEVTVPNLPDLRVYLNLNNTNNNTNNNANNESNSNEKDNEQVQTTQQPNQMPLYNVKVISTSLNVDSHSHNEVVEKQARIFAYFEYYNNPHAKKSQRIRTISIQDINQNRGTVWFQLWDARRNKFFYVNPLTLQQEWTCIGRKGNRVGHPRDYQSRMEGENRYLIRVIPRSFLQGQVVNGGGGSQEVFDQRLKSELRTIVQREILNDSFDNLDTDNEDIEATVVAEETPETTNPPINNSNTNNNAPVDSIQTQLILELKKEVMSAGNVAAPPPNPESLLQALDIITTTTKDGNVKGSLPVPSAAESDIQLSPITATMPESVPTSPTTTSNYLNNLGGGGTSTSKEVSTADLSLVGTNAAGSSSNIRYSSFNPDIITNLDEVFGDALEPSDDNNNNGNRPLFDAPPSVGGAFFFSSLFSNVNANNSNGSSLVSKGGGGGNPTMFQSGSTSSFNTIVQTANGSNTNLNNSNNNVSGSEPMLANNNDVDDDNVSSVSSASNNNLNANATAASQIDLRKGGGGADDKEDGQLGIGPSSAHSSTSSIAILSTNNNNAVNVVKKKTTNENEDISTDNTRVAVLLEGEEQAKASSTSGGASEDTHPLQYYVDVMAGFGFQSSKKNGALSSFFRGSSTSSINLNASVTSNSTSTPRHFMSEELKGFWSWESKDSPLFTNSPFLPFHKLPLVQNPNAPTSNAATSPLAPTTATASGAGAASDSGRPAKLVRATRKNFKDIQRFMGDRPFPNSGPVAGESAVRDASSCLSLWGDLLRGEHELKCIIDLVMSSLTYGINYHYNYGGGENQRKSRSLDANWISESILQVLKQINGNPTQSSRTRGAILLNILIYFASAGERAASSTYFSTFIRQYLIPYAESAAESRLLKYAVKLLETRSDSFNYLWHCGNSGGSCGEMINCLLCDLALIKDQYQGDETTSTSAQETAAGKGSVASSRKNSGSAILPWYCRLSLANQLVIQNRLSESSSLPEIPSVLSDFIQEQEEKLLSTSSSSYSSTSLSQVFGSKSWKTLVTWSQMGTSGSGGGASSVISNGNSRLLGEIRRNCRRSSLDWFNPSMTNSNSNRPFTIPRSESKFIFELMSFFKRLQSPSSPIGIFGPVELKMVADQLKPLVFGAASSHSPSVSANDVQLFLNDQVEANSICEEIFIISILMPRSE